MFGSIMAFASLEGSGKTAPGQMTAAQMKQAWEAMKP
jgi:3-dehydroquinate dehydratase